MNFSCYENGAGTTYHLYTARKRSCKIISKCKYWRATV